MKRFALFSALLLLAPLAAQTQFAELGKSYLPRSANDFTESLVLGDVDGDGDLDLVLGNRGRQSKLYLNDGQGRFQDVTATRLPQRVDNTQAVVLFDVDGDGDLDLVLGNNPRQNRLYLNDGKGTFTDVTALQFPKDTDVTLSLAFGDVDGDRDLDLVIGNAGQNKLYLNDGRGRFSLGQLPSDRDASGAVVLGDVDGDSDLDILLGNNPQNRLYLNDGAGKFTDVTSTSLPKNNGDTTMALVLGDIDKDGDLDLMLANAHLDLGTPIDCAASERAAGRCPQRTKSKAARSTGRSEGSAFLSDSAKQNQDPRSRVAAPQDKPASSPRVARAHMMGVQ